MMTQPVSASVETEPRPAVFSWLAVGFAGTAFLFVLATHAPDGWQIPGVLTTALGCAIGWGWGKLGQSLLIPRRASVCLVVGLALAGGQFLGAWKTHQDRVQFLKSKMQPIGIDSISTGAREALNTDRDDETAEEREARLKLRDNFNAAEQHAKEMQSRRLEFTSSLAARLERTGKPGLMQAPWPFVVWCVEVVLGSVLGAGLAYSTLKRPVIAG